MKVGLFMSACALFESLELYEEAIENLACAGQMTKAKELAEI